jgi:cytochrome c-type biogenesis protein CcmH/NrfG
LADAKIALSKGNIDDAVSIFSEHIKSNSLLDEIISELKNSLDHYYPIDISLWQTLGDAYFKKNQLKNALAAYSKAEELLI